MAKSESTREQMFTSIASWQTTDLSQKEWCKQQEIPYHVFQYWYRLYREDRPDQTSDNSFVRLTVKPQVDVACEVVFTDGTKIVFREPVSVQYLKGLLF